MLKYFTDIGRIDDLLCKILQSMNIVVFIYLIIFLYSFPFSPLILTYFYG
jgi:hypothetical protein